MDSCVWYRVFNENEKTVLQEGFTATGLMSILCGIWLSLTLAASSLRHDKTYNNLANFTLAALVRRIVPITAYLPFLKCIGSEYNLEAKCCEFFAFMETFLAVFEVECLTHICIERYVVAKYITNGWTITSNHYCLFLSLCFLFASIYSFPPLFGLGHYGYDFTCATCTFDIILPESWEKYFILVVFLLRSVKPFVVMITMLVWARTLEQKYDNTEKSRDLKRFTGVVAKITAVNLICWTPIATIRGWVILSQILLGRPMLLVAANHIQWAMWIHWIAPVFTVIALFVYDRRVRTEMMLLCDKNVDCSLQTNKND